MTLDRPKSNWIADEQHTFPSRVLFEVQEKRWIFFRSLQGEHVFKTTILPFPFAWLLNISSL